MLSATPHDGKARSFASLVNMLDATAIADPDNYSKEDFRPGLVIRRFKKDVKEQVRDAFRDREVFKRRFPASAAEEAAYEALLAIQVADSRAGRASRNLFLVGLEKALFSSPAACLETVQQRIGRRERELAKGVSVDVTTLEAEIAGLDELRTALERITPEAYSKYQALLNAIGGGKPFRWRSNDPADRLVIFTERIATLNWLRDRLAVDLMLKPGQMEILHGGMSDVDQQRVVEDFGNALRPVRLLLCSDVASEGINLHYRCHRLIHFDMPWSLMVFQQRNGRVDRYGQTETPQIVYLVAESANDTIRGDTRILEVLMEKDNQAYENIGDPSVFMDVYDIDAEEKITRKAIASGESAREFDRSLTPTVNEGDDLLAMFLQANSDQGVAERQLETGPPPPLSLFDNELRYCEAALHRLKGERSQPIRFNVDAESATLTMDAPDDLVARFGFLPPEILPESRRFVLTTDRSRMTEAIVESRREESAWPRLHYLWRLSPVVAWVNDRVLSAYGRSEAPVLAGVPSLARDETIFVMSGLVPNLKSHPLVYEWIAVSFRNGTEPELVPFESLLDRTGLGHGEIANPEQEVDGPRLASLLPMAVDLARNHFRERRDRFERSTNVKLEDEIRALDEFRARKLRQLDLDLGEPEQGDPLKRHRLEHTRANVEEVHDEYLKWIEETMTTEPHPWIKVICAMTPPTR